MSTQQVLTGKNAFYHQDDYLSETRKELSSSLPLTPIYTHNTENKVWRVVKDILSVIVFPVGLYRGIHALIGKIMIPAASPTFMGYSEYYADQERSGVDLDSSVEG